MPSRKRRPRKKPIYEHPEWGCVTPEEPSNSDESLTAPKVIGCSGKRRYPDLISAHAAADHMCSLIGSSEVYLYLCKHCKGYHLTKAPVSPEGELNRWAYFFGKD